MSPLLGFIAATTPAPEFNPDTVTPGPGGFFLFFFVVVAVVLLALDMIRRVRRTNYRAEISARLEAEVAAKNANTPDKG